MPPTTHADLKRYFLPYQIRWICDDRPVSVAEKSRRIGWTYASAFRAVDRRLRLGTNLFYSSADRSAAREFIEDCARWARVFQAVATDLGERVLDEDEGITAFGLRFANGARIVAGSSNPRFFRSKGGDADADEFAFHPRPRELYKAMQPAALIWGHQLRVWSTHNGAGTFFDRLAGQAKLASVGVGKDSVGVSGYRGVGVENGAFTPTPRYPDTPTPLLSSTPTPRYPDTPTPLPSSTPTLPSATPITNQRLAHHRVTLIDAVNQGLVERIRNLSEPNLTARREFIEEIRASCPDEAAFREEYLCEPSADGNALLGYDLIAACEVANLQLLEIDRLTRASGGFHPDTPTPRYPDTASPSDTPSPRHSDTEPRDPLYAGFDVGRRQDRSVLWVVEPVGDVLWTRCVAVCGDMPFARQEALLDRLLVSRRLRRLCIDSTGMGMMLAERLREKHAHRVEPIHFTADVKNELAMPLVRRFQERQVRIPADPAIREDLHKVRRTVTAAHHVRLAAPRDADGHADRFWALALACHAAEQSPAAAMPSAARKPVGW